MSNLFIPQKNLITLYRFLVLCGALFILNLALTFHNHWPTLGIQFVPVISLDLAVILLLLVLQTRLDGLNRRSRWVLLSLFTLMVVGRYLIVTITALFGRRVDLFWEGQHLPAVIQMLTNHVSGWILLGGILGLLMVLMVMLITLHWAISRVASAMIQPNERWLLTYVTTFCLALGLAGYASSNFMLEKWFAAPLIGGLTRQVNFAATAAQVNDRPVTMAPLVESDLGRLRGADVFIIFFESYGVSIFDKPTYAHFLAKDFAVFEKTLRESGWSSAAARVKSTTFGGSSWLAHASLLSGIKIADQRDYQALLKGGHPTLINRFEQMGYRTIALMPGLKTLWLEGLSYGFDAVYSARRLDYQGPPFGWWTIPDQFSLYRVHQDEVAQLNRKPLLVFFPTITSHAPFAPVAPYQENWTQLGETVPFAHVNVIEPSLSFMDMSALAPAYMRSVRYNLQVLKGYLEKFAPPNALFLVLGDHQPPAVVSGPHASWDVPVHVISRDSHLIRTFYRAGFQPGFIPNKSTWGSIETLNPLLLRTLDSGSVTSGF
jgi:hypothetical protein